MQTSIHLVIKVIVVFATNLANAYMIALVALVPRFPWLLK